MLFRARTLSIWFIILGLLIGGSTWTWEPGSWGPPWCWTCSFVVTLLRIAAVILILGGGAFLASTIRQAVKPAARPASPLG